MFKKRFARRMVVTVLAAVLLVAGATAAVVSQAAGSTNPDRSASAAPGTAFTYQGVLNDGGVPAEGVYDLRFRLYNALILGSQVAPPVFLGDMVVSEGLFTAVLDFGEVFNGAPRFLEVAVRPGNSSDAYTTLSPRQPLTPVPYSIHASIAPWNGLTGVPADIADGDQDTVYEAGFGLKLSQNQIPVRYLVDQETIQRRVTGNCEVGQAIASISVDGQITCNDMPDMPVAPRPLNNNMHLDAGAAGFHKTAITIGSDGLPIISFWHSGNESLMVAHCNDLACSEPNLEEVDNGGVDGQVGQHSAITIGSDGLPIISYYDAKNKDLKVAHCEDLVCESPATISRLVADGDVGQFSSITIGSDGLPWISHYANGDLEVIHCENEDCSADPTIIPGDDDVDVGKFSSIAIGIDGLAYVSYYDAVNDDLKLARCTDTSCSAENVNTFGGQHTSITIGADGLPLISYLADNFRQLRVLHCGDLVCSSGSRTPTLVDTGGTDGLKDTSITIGSDGLGLISYYSNGDLKVVHCKNLTCSSSDAFTLDTKNLVGRYSSITIGPDGLAYVSYLHSTPLGNNLKLTRTTLGRGIGNR